MRASTNASTTRDEMSGARIDRDAIRLFPRTPLRWDAGQGCLLDCPARLSITADGKGDSQAENLNNYRQLQALPPVAKLVEFFLKFTLASRLVILYARGRDMYRVPIES
jgi:hypothetical protein